MNIINSTGSMRFRHVQDVRQMSAPNMSEKEIIEVMAAGDVFLLLEGGVDVHPRLYNEENLYSYPGSTRDADETALWKLAKQYNVPILGICRGHQLLAVLEGGSLWQDLGKQLNADHPHLHTIELTDHARACEFDKLMESNPTGSPHVVNSMHHQAVRTVPAMAQVLATGPGGVNEALLYPNALSVQWHPEFLGHVEFIGYMRRFMRK